MEEKGSRFWANDVVGDGNCSRARKEEKRADSPESVDGGIEMSLEGRKADHGI